MSLVFENKLQQASWAKHALHVVLKRKEHLKNELNVSIVDVDEPYVTVVIKDSADNLYVGVSKCNRYKKGDTFFHDIGINKAMSRAVEKFEFSKVAIDKVF